MITEDYISFETAKLLKEKGFDEDINLWYDEDGGLFFKHRYDIINDYRVKQNQEVYQCPSLQMAMKWLREVHNIAIETEWEHLWYAYVKPMTSKPSEQDYYQCESSKYEEVCEAAIKYCLENLI